MSSNLVAVVERTAQREQEEPRWLTPEQRDAWIGLARVITWLPAALDAQLQRDSGMSHVEYQVLSWLSMTPGRRARMSTVAEVANVNLSHLSRVVARLESRGWVERRPDPDDGRYTLAILTEAGWTTVVEAAPGHVETVQRFVFDQLSAEQTSALQEIGTLIARGIRPESEAPRPPWAQSDT